MMVIHQQHCLEALGILVPKEINACRKNVGSLVLVAGTQAGGSFSPWSKAHRGLSLSCPIPGE